MDRVCCMCGEETKKSDLKEMVTGKMVCTKCIKTNYFNVCKKCKKVSEYTDGSQTCGTCD